MKPDQEPERTPSREAAAVKGRVTPVPAERSPDDRATAGEGTTDRAVGKRGEAGEAEDVSRREALKGHVDPATAGPAPGDRARTGVPAREVTAGAHPRSGPADAEGRTDSGGRADSRGGAGDPPGRDERLLPLDAYDKFSLRMRHAVGRFVDGPQASVEEADHVLEELAGRLTEAVTRRRRALRTSWNSGGDGRAAASDTEQLRLALRDYREMTERLLKI
ncbi:hypothetical protein ABZX90_02230 [Streptomyces sp. NPDC002935]|uniref:hypothetical protein n=1 Tax=Streptomyces sp. NPDC002935 TaxID=3154545 RepID=UPI0033B5F27F